MLGRVRRSLWGVSRRLITSYALVTVFAVVLVEAFVLGYQVPKLLSDAELHTQVGVTAESFWSQLSQRYPDGVPAGTLLAERGQRTERSTVRTSPNSSALVVPAVTGAISSHKSVTAVVAISEDGTIIASSAPSRYPAGQSATNGLPAATVAAIKAGLLKGVSGGIGSTPYGSVSWTLYGGAYLPLLPPSTTGLAYLYVQAPQPSGLVNPISAWGDLGKISGGGTVSTTFDALLLVIVPLVALLGLLASRRLVRRVRRLERVAVAVAGGDYTFTVPGSGTDEVGRLEANFATMTQQLSSAIVAERERASSEARAAERSRIAREIHDAISQHLFGLRMIASGMRR
ncbi:MAG: HAMP domain-containing protein, partial [Acidimicrobiales bacterium]